MSANTSDTKRMVEHEEMGGAPSTLDERTSPVEMLYSFSITPSRSPSPIISNDDKKVVSFFYSLVPDEIKTEIYSRNISFILVCHMAPTLFPFLEAIKKLGNIVLIIPKGFQRESAKTIMNKLRDEKKHYMGDGYFFDSFSVDDPNAIKKVIKEKGIEFIQGYTKGNKFIIIDIGGYFAETFEKIVLETTSEIEDLRNKFIGIVEDTENGHQKYFNVIERLKKEQGLRLQPSQIQALSRLYSVARSALKSTEDYNVGKSIVEASGTIIRIDAHVTLERMETAGIIGFGKIGKSIAEHLRQKNLREIIVYDSDIIRQMEASSLGFKVVSRPYLIQHSQIIFSATGGRCLKAEDIIYMQDNIFIASCTSAEDEFDLSFRDLIKKGSKLIKGNISKIRILEKSINMLDDGNAVNFVHGAVNGPYIYSVQGSLILSAINLIKPPYHQSASVELATISMKELAREKMKFIAEKWLRFFDQCDSNIDLHLGTYLIKNRKYGSEILLQILNYLDEHGYFICCEELKTMMTLVLNVDDFLKKETSSNIKLNIKLLIKLFSDIAEKIKWFLGFNMFISLNGYIANLLIKLIEQIESTVQSEYELDKCCKKEKMKLYLLRSASRATSL